MRFGNLCVQARTIVLTFHYLCRRQIPPRQSPHKLGAVPGSIVSQKRRYKKILHNIIPKDFLSVLSTEKRYTDMDYVELNVRVTDPELSEILTAELAELPYESFQTEGEVLKAYIPRERLADCMQ